MHICKNHIFETEVWLHLSHKSLHLTTFLKKHYYSKVSGNSIKVFQEIIRSLEQWKLKCMQCTDFKHIIKLGKKSSVQHSPLRPTQFQHDFILLHASDCS